MSVRRSVTLMRMICGILKPNSGSISFDGMDVSEEAYRASLGYLPQDFGYYPEFTGQDFLYYMAALKGLSKPQAKKKTAELLQLVSLEDVAKKKTKTYSGGIVSTECWRRYGTGFPGLSLRPEMCSAHTRYPRLIGISRPGRQFPYSIWWQAH